MSIDLDDPIALMLAATEALRVSSIEVVAYGGLVLAMYGEPRETRDADLAVATLDIEAARHALAEAGLNTIVAFAAVRFGGNELTRLSVLGGGQFNTIDFVRPRSARYASGVLDRALVGSLRATELHTVSPEDFILLKVLSTRERDLDDARSVVAALADRLDGTVLSEEARKLAEELPDHDVVSRLRSVSPPGGFVKTR